MPYIKLCSRMVLDRPLDELVRLINGTDPHNRAGEVNYSMAYLISQLIKQQGCSYAVLNEFIGALECCKLELYRRLVAEYEDKKCAENGDVFNG